MRRVFLAALLGLGLGCHRAPPSASEVVPDPAAELRNARDALRSIHEFTVERTTTTEFGSAVERTEIDCAGGYYHKRSVEDLSPQGVESNTTVLHGRPRSHREEEVLFVDERSYRRSTGSWESAPPSVDDAQPKWASSGTSYDPTEECDAYQRPDGIEFLPFEKILAANRITYLGTRGEGVGACREYRVAYPGPAAQVTGTICVGIADHLPRAVASGEASYRFSYAPFVKIVAP